MYHCHILMHEDDGMMGQFLVGTEYTTVKSNNIIPDNISAYPNPATTSINVKIEGNAINNNANISVYNVLGNKVLSGEMKKEITLNTTEWARGIYIISVMLNNYVAHKTFVIR